VADRASAHWTLQLEYRFDRLLPEKLVQAYEALLPNQA
jgi:hypothetical protein